MPHTEFTKPYPELEGLFYTLHDGFTIPRASEPEIMTRLRHLAQCGKCRWGIARNVSRESLPWVILAVSFWMVRRARP